MSSRMIDYNNTIIYKIYCKDEKITEVYVGHTTDFVKRRYAHRYTCENNQSQLKLYKFIREHGGWENWEMDIIAFEKCRDLEHAKQKEQEYFVSLSATLNSIEPFPDISKTKINATDKMYLKKYVKQEVTKSIIENQAKNATQYVCEPCDFRCCKQSNYKSHLDTAKHKKMTDKGEKIPKNATAYTCDCGKQYKYRQGLHLHQKNCTPKNEVVEPVSLPPAPVVGQNDQLIVELLTKNKELMEMLLVQTNKPIVNNQITK